MNNILEIIKLQKDIIFQGGGIKKLEKERAAGKMTARERVSYLLDIDTQFLEVCRNIPAGDHSLAPPTSRWVSRAAR